MASGKVIHNQHSSATWRGVLLARDSCDCGRLLRARVARSEFRGKDRGKGLAAGTRKS
jgi:hypothetical protein